MKDREYVIKDLTLEQVSDIYRKWLSLHFPQDEIKPLKNIQQMWNAGCYHALGMYEQEGESLRFIGYAFFAKTSDSNMLLLDYLAMVEAYRGQGMGGIFLREMKKRLQAAKEILGIIIETEDVAFADSGEALLERKRRDRFYECNGAKRTAIRSEIYGVHYAIWQLPVTRYVEEEECRTALKDIYKEMIPGEKNEKYVSIG